MNGALTFGETLGPCFISRARGVVVSHPLSMREALGSIPSVSIRLLTQAKMCLNEKYSCARRSQQRGDSHGHACISRESNPGHIDGNDVFYH